MNRSRTALSAFRAVARSFGEAVAARAEGYIDRIHDVERQDSVAMATVVGTRPYRVRLLTDDDGDYFSDCTCPVEVDCKHGAALALFLDLDSGDRRLGAWIDSLARAAGDPGWRSSPYAVLYVLGPQPSGAIGLEIRKARPGKRGGWTKGSVMRGSQPPDWVAAADAARIVRARKLGDRFGLQLEIDDFDTEFIAELAATGRLVWSPTGGSLRPGPPRAGSLAWCWQPGERSYALAPTSGLAILRARAVHYVDPGRHEIGPLDLGSELLAAATARAPRVPEAAFAGVRAGLDRLAGQAIEVIGGPAAGPPLALPAPAFELDLHVDCTSWNIEVTASYRARYGKRTYTLADPGDGHAGRRDLLSEAVARRRAESMVDELRGSTRGWMAEAIGERLVPRLRADGWTVEVTGDLEIDPPQVPEEWLELVVPETSGGDWFYYSLGVELDGKRTELLPLLLRALRDSRVDIGAAARGEHPSITLEIGRGARLYIPGERLTRWLRPLIELNLRGLDHGRLHLPAPVISDFTGELSSQFAEPPELARARERLAELVELPLRREPAGFRGELRDYQRRGLAWLCFLHESGYGGLLADDMGLGKTVQLLAFLEQLRVSGGLSGPALVVAPLSVVHNWQREAARFAPSLDVLVHHGPGRAREAEALRRHDLVITSYQTLARDAERLGEIAWTTLIADEAQAIKNARTKLWRAVASLKATSRFCVTGTPVENRLMELWSQTQITMPGLFGTADRFGKLSRRIERGEESFEPIARRLRPFLLRRSKADVDIDLPPKTEIVERVDLGTQQSDLYESLRLILEKKVRDALATRGVDGSAIVVLDALLRLRQSCCDPRLVKSKEARQIHESAKLERLLEMLDELVAAGRSTLVFSQFTSMLDLIEAACESRGIDTLKLTGKTRDRERLIAGFQAGQAPVFLISLKAGGTGINLTRADTVIHYDPWWNPAVEAQATDRAHRIGQDKPVFVYKLIAAGTVEEKVLDLQSHKLALSDLALTDAGLTHFSADDITALFTAM